MQGAAPRGGAISRVLRALALHGGRGRAYRGISAIRGDMRNT